MAKSSFYFGRNPLVEALRSGVKVDEIFVESQESETWLRAVLRSEFEGVAVKVSTQFPRDLKRDGARTQGVAFRSDHRFYVDEADINWDKQKRVLLCNHIEDVQNLGALSRAAAAFGFGLVAHESQRSARVSEAVVRASMGLAFRIKFLEFSNLLPFVLRLQASGFSVFGLEANGEHSLFEWDFHSGDSLALVMGSESRGLAKPLERKLDFRLRIPMLKGVDSINVAQAGAIAMARLYAAGPGAMRTASF